VVSRCYFHSRDRTFGTLRGAEFKRRRPGECHAEHTVSGEAIALRDPTLLIGPGQRATITNLSDTSKEVTLVITGSWHLTEMPDGNIVYDVNGRNLLWGGTLPTLTQPLELSRSRWTPPLKKSRRFTAKARNWMFAQ
jgi:hypothetical protein